MGQLGVLFHSCKRSTWRKYQQKEERKITFRDTTNLVEGNNEGCFVVFDELKRLERLLFEAVHDVHDEDGDVAEG